MPPSFLLYIRIYFIPLSLICSKMCKVWEASEPDDTEHCVCSGCVLHLLAAAVGCVWGCGSQVHSSCSLALCTGWGRNGLCLSWDTFGHPFGPAHKQTCCGLPKARVLPCKAAFYFETPRQKCQTSAEDLWGFFVFLSFNSMQNWFHVISMQIK